MFNHYLCATAKLLSKIRILGGRATGSTMCERKNNKLKIVEKQLGAGCIISCLLYIHIRINCCSQDNQI